MQSPGWMFHSVPFHHDDLLSIDGKSKCTPHIIKMRLENNFCQLVIRFCAQEPANRCNKNLNLVPRKRTRGRSYRYREDSSEEEDDEEETDGNEDDTTDGDEVSAREGDSDESTEGESDEEINDEIPTCRNIVEKLMKYQYSDIFRLEFYDFLLFLKVNFNFHFSKFEIYAVIKED